MKKLALMLATGVALWGCGGSTPYGTGGGAGGGSGGGSGGCGPSTCTGCCFNGSCQPGSTAAGCGKNGDACAQCAANQVCRADQACGVDPESTWLVQPRSASIAASNNGSPWDGDGSPPDVQVSGWCPPSTTASWTPEASDTYSPAWTTGGCTAKAKDLLASGWTFQVFDVDLVNDDTITSRLTVTLAENAFVEGGFSLQPTGALNAMTVQLTKQ